MQDFLKPAITKSKSNMDESYIIPRFLTFLNQVKVFHWQTDSYAKHKATDKLYDKMNELIDSFIETLQGKPNVGRLRVDFSGHSVQNIDSFDMAEYLGEFKYFLMDELDNILESLGYRQMRNDDLKNIRDEMLSLVNTTLYLFTLH